MDIRQLTSSDADGLLAFFQSFSKEVADFYHPFPFTREAVEKHLEDSDAGNTICLGLINAEGEIDGHGFIGGVKEEKPCFGIGLRDRAIGQGWGRVLMEAVMDQADAMKLPVVMLTVYKTNHRAKALYEKMGFIVTGETCDRGYGESWVMEKRV